MPLSRLFPNIMTLTGMCAGLTSIRFALNGKWELAAIAIIIAGIIDGMDGRLARLLKSTSTFGAELDSLADFLSFGVAPAIVMYLWVLHEVKGIGWAVALFFTVCCAIRLARFNSTAFEPKKSDWPDRFFVGIPAPVGGALSLFFLIFTLQFGPGLVDFAWLNIVFVTLIGALMVSHVPTISFKKLSVPHHRVVPVMLGAGLFIAALIIEPWLTLMTTGTIYLVTFPLTIRAYQRAVAGNRA